MTAGQRRNESWPSTPVKRKLVKLVVHHERMMARMDSQLEKMEACLGKREATDLEANPEQSPRRSMMRSPRKRPQRKLLEH
jgi:hypothetical protein